MSITSVTSAIPLDFLLSVPEKMTSSIFPPRSIFGLCSPSTHLIASLMLLFPLPLGPTMQVIPLSNSITTGSAKDLNPCISIFLKYIYHCSFSSIAFAAFCSACFLLFPLPVLTGLSLTASCTTNVLSWSGPSSSSIL